jgi:hypothetical protein
MRHVYSVIRFVPDPARDEAVNIGLLAGSDESNEWSARTVGNWQRARAIDDARALPEVSAHIQLLTSLLDEYTRSHEQLAPAPLPPEVSEAWLRQLADSSRNVLQFTSPRPVVADSAEGALDLLWDELIVDPAARRYAFQKKHRAVAALRRAFRQRGVPADRLVESPRLFSSAYTSAVDFAAHNGQVAALANCWSFQLPDKEKLLEEVKAWAWAIRDLRRGGARIAGPSEQYEVAPGVYVAVVYVPPASADDRRAFDEARRVFEDADVSVNDAVNYDQADVVAERVALAVHRR